jgi:hypothetical protein
MALFFNLEKLEKDSQGSGFKLVSLLKYHWDKKPQPGLKVALNKNYAGSNFILNPEPLFLSSCDVSYKIQYIKLAGKRDWFLYKTHGVTTLDLSYYPDINVSNISHNPLLTITNNTIKFKFEEYYNGSKIWRNKG